MSRGFDRRGFLSLLLASAAAESVDFERLLWVPKPIIAVPALPLARSTGSLLTPGAMRALAEYATALSERSYQAAIDRQAWWGDYLKARQPRAGATA